MQRKILFFLYAICLVISIPAHARSPAPEDAKAFILSPRDGATVASPFVVQFGLSGMAVSPAGEKRANSGHFHLLIDVDTLPPMDQPLPKDEHHLHFGKGQTKTKLQLPPGKHTLQLLLGDYQHIPHDPPVISDKITITVTAPEQGK
jgi:hypothetical protein